MCLARREAEAEGARRKTHTNPVVPSALPTAPSEVMPELESTGVSESAIMARTSAADDSVTWAVVSSGDVDGSVDIGGSPRWQVPQYRAGDGQAEPLLLVERRGPHD